MAVKKVGMPAVAPIEAEPQEPIKIKIKDREYPLPNPTVKQLRKLLKVVEIESPDKMTEVEGIDRTLEFYYQLLHPSNPDLKKTDLEDMPAYQLGLEFYLKVRTELMKIPLV